MKLIFENINSFHKNTKHFLLKLLKMIKQFIVIMFPTIFAKADNSKKNAVDFLNIKF